MQEWVWSQFCKAIALGHGSSEAQLKVFDLARLALHGARVRGFVRIPCRGSRGVMVPCVTIMS